MATWMRVLLVVLAMASLLPGVSVRAQAVRQPSGCVSSPTTSGASPSQLAAADNAFGFRLLSRELGGSDNTFLSPLSVALALDMTYDGARGQTASAMARVLGVSGLSRAAVRQQAAALLAQMRSSGAGLSVANSLWARQNVRFRAGFMNDIRGSYGATVRRLDFSSPAAPATINRWVNCATRGKISGIIRTIPPDVILYLINAVYFHGDWAHPFPSSGTHSFPFTTGSGSRVHVPMMHQTNDFPYYQGSGFQLIQIPYKVERFSMLVLEPTHGSLQSFVPELSAAKWRSWTGHLAVKYGALALPRFSLSNQYVLNHPLGTLGMGNAFSSRADFSGLCTQPCKLSDVRHKTYLAVTERGTTAAAVTSVGVTDTVAPQFSVVVDRPFFLAIQDSQTGAILFLGAVGKP